MTDSRKRMLSAVREALGRATPSREQAAAARRNAVTETSPRLQWTQDRLERFTERLEKVNASWNRIQSMAELSAAAAAYLEQAELPRRLVLSPHPLLQQAGWGDDWDLPEATNANADGAAGLGVAYAGIAETGTVVMISGEHRPTALHLLPDHKLLLLAVDDVVDHMEDVWQRVSEGALTRTINLITGPSRTADVEQTIQLGAHGPRSLHVILLG